MPLPRGMTGGVALDKKLGEFVERQPDCPNPRQPHPRPRNFNEKLSESQSELSSEWVKHGKLLDARIENLKLKHGTYEGELKQIERRCNEAMDKKRKFEATCNEMLEKRQKTDDGSFRIPLRS